VDVFPFVQPRQLVAADNPEKPIRRMKPSEVAHRIDRVARAGLTELEIGNGELRSCGEREAQHGEAIRRGGVDALGLVRHLRRGHEDDAVELVLGAGVLGGVQMATVHRIKTPAEKSEVHASRLVVEAPAASETEARVGAARD